MDMEGFLAIVATALTVLSAIFAVEWRRAKSLLKEASEALSALYNAIEDDKITKEEAKRIAKEFEDLIRLLKR